MELTVNRKMRDGVTTIGDLLINGVYECHTLEDTDRKLTQEMPLADILKIKIPCATAIPAGKYEVIINYSDRFKRPMPILLNVPGYVGVRIHWGNYANDTDGCILLGKTKSTDFIGQSVDEFNIFFGKLSDLLKTQKVYITIT